MQLREVQVRHGHGEAVEGQGVMKLYVRALILSAIIGGALPSWVWAQPGFPQRGVEILHALYAGVNPQDDDARRDRITAVCAAMARELGPRWGGKKRAGLGDEFRSPDSLAYLEDNGSVSVWDVQLSSGALDVFAGKPPNYPRLSPSEATFMPCGGEEPPPVTPVPSQPPPVIVQPAPVDLSGLSSQLDRLIADLAAHEKAESEFREQARGIWKEFFAPVLEFSAKYLLPAVGAWFLGKEAAQQ